MDEDLHVCMGKATTKIKPGTQITQAKAVSNISLLTNFIKEI
jgi:hypothetical protein